MTNIKRYIEKVYSLINDSSFKERFRCNPCDFSRRRNLSFSTTILCILDLSKKSLPIRLNELFFHANISITKQAYSLARQKIDWKAFKAINDEIISQYYCQKDLKFFKGKYLLLSIDGSCLYLPNTKETIKYFGVAINQIAETVLAKLSMLYDILNKIVLDVRLKPYKTGERTTALEHLEWLKEFQNKINKKVILVLDRGYPCTGLFLLLNKLKIDFVCRGSHATNDAYIKQICSEKYDNTIVVSADTKERRKSVRVWLGMPPEEAMTTLTTHVRGVKLNKDYPIFTSLTNLKIQELSKLYKSRWGIETAYRTIKIDTLIENFSGHKVIAIYQEVYATIIVQNLARIFENELEQDQRSYPNHRQVLGLIKIYINAMINGPTNYKRIIKKAGIISWIKILPDRAYKRKKDRKLAFMRKKRLCYA